jgi:hypothetical protein
MSPDEQNVIIGQTVTERSALVLHLATTDKLLGDLADELKMLAEDIRDLIEPDRIASRPQPTFANFGALHKRGDFAGIVSLAQERKKIYDNLQATERKLRNMGVPI